MSTSSSFGLLARLTGRRLPPRAVIARFALTGGSVAAVHFGLVSLLFVLDVPIQVGLALAYVVALATHFTLNRQWVFAHDAGYELRLSGQGMRYLLVAGLSYTVTAAGVAVLPDALGVHELIAFFLTTAAMACVSFLLLHLWIFRTVIPGRTA